MPQPYRPMSDFPALRLRSCVNLMLEAGFACYPKLEPNSKSMMKTKLTLFVGVLAVSLLGMGCAVTIEFPGNQKPAKPEEPKEPAFVKEGLVAYYPFNGNAKDESGNWSDGKVVGATLTEDRHDGRGKAYSFDGVDDYISLGDLDLTGSLTLNAWINSDVIKGDHYHDIIHKKQSLNFRAGGKGNTKGKLLGNVNSEGNARSYSSSTLSIGIWQMMTMVFDANTGTLKLYVEGQDKTVVNNAGPGGARQNNFAMHIGSYSDPSLSSNEWFHGSIDDVRIYNRALSAEEVKALYDLEKPKGK